MLTKYILNINDTEYELQPDDIQNWDEILCSYVRQDYDGVVRSVTSNFIFVNRAREVLRDCYLQNRFVAKASISIFTIDNRWTYKKQFECPLDLSTIEWDTNTLKINCLDNSLAALIKANKSTKYEFVVGSDITHDELFLFSRLPIKESLTYEITEGYSDESDGSLIVPKAENRRTFCGITCSDEIYIGEHIAWNDDQTKDPGSYLIEAVKDVVVDISARIEFNQCYPGITDQRDIGDMLGFFTVIRADGTSAQIGSMMSFGSAGKTFRGDFESEAELRDKYPTPQAGDWATVRGIVWDVWNRGTMYLRWICQNVTADRYRRASAFTVGRAELKEGDKIAFTTIGPGAHVYSSAFNLSWLAKGTPCSIPAFHPKNIAQTLLRRISKGYVNPRVVISDYDSRLADTLLLAAESIRNIPGAKFYTSFSEFCDWMATVFGYVYTIEEQSESPFQSYREALGGCTSTPYNINNGVWSNPNSAELLPEHVWYMEYYGKFAAYNGSTTWYLDFPGHEHYNDPETGLARTDTLFKLKRWGNGVESESFYYFEKDAEGNTIFEPREFSGDVSDMFLPFQSVRFQHRSEIMSKDASIRRLDNCRGLTYSVDSSVIYSSVTVGYDKKDYENINGRDEFNFSNTYTTGCALTDKTLSLISKYRADSYGIEFAAQKRGAESTDSTSDSDVFFVLTKADGNGMKIADCSCKVEGTVSDEVFNAAFSPMACIRANAGYIGLQADNLTLAFTSSTGNSDIIIDGEPMAADIVLTSPLATCGIVQFTTDEVDSVAVIDELIEVESEEGVLYRGFLMDVDVKYAKTEAAKYKLIVKEIEL